MTFKTVDPGVKIALQNLLAYGGKLFDERESVQNKDLEAKINHTSDFIKTVLSSDDLSSEALAKVVKTFEQNDENRGTGFYRFHSLFAGKRYRDEKGRSRLIKSSLGWLVDDVLRAVEKAENKEEETATSSSGSSM